MAKAAMIKIKLLSTADTGYFYVTKKNAPYQNGKSGVQKRRSGRPQARRIQGNQDKIVWEVHPAESKRLASSAR